MNFEINNSKKIGWILWALIVSAIAYVKYAHHELWKDEWQAWFIARDMHLGQMFSFLYYDGHPSLWYLYLKLWVPISSIFGEVNTIQLAHFTTVAIGLYFISVRFQIHWLIKLLWVSGYFLFFEYGVVNRGYFLAILLACWAGEMIRKDIISKSDKWKLFLAFFLLCQTEVYGIFLAIGLILIYIIRYKKTTWTKDYGIRGFAIGLVLFIFSVFPRTSDHIVKSQIKSWDLSEKITMAFQGNLANTFTIGITFDTARYGGNLTGILISLAVIVGLYIIFRNHKTEGVAMAIFLLMMIVFSVVFFAGGVRHWGMGMIGLLVLVELGASNKVLDKLSLGALTVFGLFSLFHGIEAVKSDITLPFTNAKDAGEFIKKYVPEKVPVVSLNKFMTTPVIGYAGREIFELPEGVPFSYFRWLDKIYVPTEHELKLFGQFKGVGGIIIIDSKPLDENRYPQAELWRKFTETNYKDENYYIYTLKR